MNSAELAQNLHLKNKASRSLMRRTKNNVVKVFGNFMNG